MGELFMREASQKFLSTSREPHGRRRKSGLGKKPKPRTRRSRFQTSGSGPAGSTSSRSLSLMTTLHQISCLSGGILHLLRAGHKTPVKSENTRGKPRSWHIKSLEVVVPLFNFLRGFSEE